MHTIDTNTGAFCCCVNHTGCYPNAASSSTSSYWVRQRAASCATLPFTEQAADLSLITMALMKPYSIKQAGLRKAIKQ